MPANLPRLIKRGSTRSEVVWKVDQHSNTASSKQAKQMSTQGSKMLVQIGLKQTLLERKETGSAQQSILQKSSY